MEKMTPPPNYYGAPYPQPQMQANNSYPKNPQYGNPPFTQENVFPVQGNQEGVTGLASPSNAYSDILESIKNVEHLYDVFRNNISKNIGKKVKVYASFTDSSKWHDVIFEGTLIAIADDFLIVKSEAENRYDLISRIYVNYISFFEN